MTLNQLVDACGWTLLHSVWQIAGIALFLAVALRIVSSERCNARYLCACAALLLMIAAIAGTFSWELRAARPIAENSVIEAPVVRELPRDASQAFVAGETETSEVILLPRVAATESSKARAAQEKPVSWRAAIETRLSRWIAPIVALWIAGVSLLSLRLCTNWLAVRRLRAGGRAIDSPVWTRALARIQKRLAVSQPVKLLQSSAAATPMVIGWLKPVVLVPMELVSGLTSAEIEAILAHELAHIRRHDYLVNLLQNVAETLLFYHPAVWWVSRQIRREREFCCDDIAARLCDGTATYARALATVETMRGAPPALSVAASGGSLLDRIRRLAGREPRQAVGASGAMTAGLVLSCAAVLLIGVAGMNADEIESAEDTAASAEVSGTVRVSGRVVDTTGKPVPNALVTFPYFVDYQKQSVSTRSSEEATFSLEIPTDRQKKIMVHLWAYADGYGIRAVRLGKLLSESKDLEDVELQLPPAEQTSYRVLLPDGSLCVGASVCPFMVQVPNGVFAADVPTGLGHWLPDDFAKVILQKSDERGEVSFSAIPTALADTMVVTAPGFGEQHFMEPKRDLKLREAGSIDGEVLANNVKELAGTKLFLTTEDSDWRHDGSAIVELDEAGRFSVPTIAIGRPRVRIAWPSERQDVPCLESQTLTVREDIPLSFEIVAKPAVKVTGRILTEDSHEPVQNAEIFVRNLTSPDFSQHVKTDENGNFEAKAYPGQIHFQLVSLGDNQTLYQNYSYPKIEKPEIPEGVEVHSLGEYYLPPVERLAGILLDETGNPLGDVKIGIRSGPFRHLASNTTTDVDGSFEIGVRDWESLRERGLRWVTVPEPTSSYELPPLRELRVVSENPLVLQVREEKIPKEALPPGFRHMTVRTVDDAGKPVPNTRVFVNVWPDEDRKYKTSKKNYFTDAEGNVEVLVPDPPRLFRVWTQKDSYVPLFAQWWPKHQPDGAQIPEEFTFKLPTGTQIGGTVVDDSGRPIEGARLRVRLSSPVDELGQRPVPSIWLSDEIDSPESTCITDTKGHWSINSVPAGDPIRVLVLLTHPDYIDDTTWGSLQAEQQVTMESLRDQSARIAMHKGVRATGTVTDADGKPIAGAVVIWGDDPYLQTGSQEVRTDAKGKYKLPPLAPGLYPLTVVAENWRPELSFVEIESEMEPQDFQLKKGSVLRVKFVDENGNPIPEVYAGIREWRGKESLYNHKHPNVLDTKIPIKADERGIYEWTWAPPDGVKYSFGKKGFQSTELVLIADGEEFVVEMKRE